MGPSKDRKQTPTEIETNVLIKSARRCTLCFHLSGDLDEKLGQLTHLDKDPSNSAEDNLAFMCLQHHTLFDSKASQHKNYTFQEVRTARNRLYEAISRKEHLRGQSADQANTVASQRAQLILLVGKPMPMPAVGHEPQVMVELKNVGPTPAYSCTYQTWIEMLPVPFTDFTDAADCSESPAPTPIYSYSPAPNSVTIVRRRALTQTELQSWQEGRINLCFRISLQYTDASKSLHHANFGYEINPAHLGLLPKYNDAD